MFEAEIAKGLARLDERVPGWIERINLDTLNMAGGYTCVLGQVFSAPEGGFYTEAAGALFDFKLGRWVNRLEAAAEFGFAIPALFGGDWGTLTDEWKEVIRARREV